MYEIAPVDNREATCESINRFICHTPELKVLGIIFLSTCFISGEIRFLVI